MNGNIVVKINDLQDLINKLDADNKKIKELMEDINKNFLEIDEEKWNSPEKKKVDDTFIPYIKKKESSVNNNFNKCLNDLISVKNKYESLYGGRDS